MSRKVEKKVVDNHTYEIGQWSVDQSLGMMTWLIKTFGESVVALLGSTSLSKMMENDIDGPAMKMMMMGLGSRLMEDEVKARMREIFSGGILCDGKQFEYNTHFQGRIGHLFKVAVAVLRVQYSDFFGASPARD